MSMKGRRPEVKDEQRRREYREKSSHLRQVLAISSHSPHLNSGGAHCHGRVCRSGIANATSGYHWNAYRSNHLTGSGMRKAAF
jgi:hypothetical protein